MEENQFSMPNYELGDFFAMLQKMILVNGKLLFNKDIYSLTSLRQKSYEKVKRARI